MSVQAWDGMASQLFSDAAFPSSSTSSAAAQNASNRSAEAVGPSLAHPGDSSSGWSETGSTGSAGKAAPLNGARPAALQPVALPATDQFVQN